MVEKEETLKRRAQNHLSHNGVLFGENVILFECNGLHLYEYNCAPALFLLGKRTEIKEKRQNIFSYAWTQCKIKLYFSFIHFYLSYAFLIQD